MKKMLIGFWSSVRNWAWQHHTAWIAIQLFLIYAWLSKLPETDSFYSVYSVTAIFAVFCMYLNRGRKAVLSTKKLFGILVFSSVFSISVIAGNYMLFEPVWASRNMLDMLLCFTGGLIICTHILSWMIHTFPLQLDISERKYSMVVFFVTFICIVTVDLGYLFTTKYPALVNYDTLSQINQIMGLSSYNNWSPYWHTKTLELFLKWGFLVFSDWNAALAFYEIWQVLFISACFAYLQMTFYQSGLPKEMLLLTFALYVLLPYNIAFTVTIGKDVLFGVGLLLMQTALYRILTHTGKYPVLNYVFFIIGSFGFSLWRTNGWYIYVIMGLLFVPVFVKKHPKVLCTMAVVALIGWILLNPYLNIRGVVDGPATEPVGVPLQQVAKVIANERQIPEEDEAVLREIFDFDMVRHGFTATTVDPVKFAGLRCSTDFYKENAGKFLWTWFRLGLKYPGDYLTAWIDLTRGYWTGGFLMGVNDEGIPENDMGLYNTFGNNIMARLYLVYFRCIEDAIVLEPLKSIGFVVWLICILWWAMLLNRRLMCVIAIPTLLVMVGLWLGAPVFAEFRYAYPLFVTSPLLLFVSIFQTKQEWT